MFYLNKYLQKLLIMTLTSIEEFILEGNVAHDVISIEKTETSLELVVCDCSKDRNNKVFVFSDLQEEYEQIFIDTNEKLEFPIPIIGFECSPKEYNKWRFVLNVGDAEWVFQSKWPVRK